MKRRLHLHGRAALLLACCLFLSSPTVAQWTVSKLSTNENGPWSPVVAVDATSGLAYFAYLDEPTFMFAEWGPCGMTSDIIGTGDAGNFWGSAATVAVGPDGAPHYAYSTFDSGAGAYVLRYRHRLGGVWQSPVTVSQHLDGYRALFLAIDAQGNAHLGYLAGFAASPGGLYYATNASGTWTETLLADAYDYAAMALDADGYAHFSFYSFDPDLYGIAYMTNASDGVWRGESILGGFNWGGGQMEGMTTGIAVEPDGTPHLLYVQSIGDDFEENHMYATKGVGGWTVEQIEDGEFFSGGGDIVVAPDGTVHVAYHHVASGDVHHATREGGGWTIEPVAFSSFWWGETMRMGAAPDGTLYLAYDGDAPYWAINQLMPAVSILPPSHDFGLVPIGIAQDQVFTVTNVGAAAMEVCEFPITGAQSFQFAVTHNCTTLEPGEGCGATVTFTPTSSGEKTATMRAQANAPNMHLLTVPLDGRGWGSFDTWAITYGGVYNEAAKDAIETADGGYIFTGYAESFNVGDADAWVVKLDPVGAIEWEMTYRGSGADEFRSIIETTGGYVVAGWTNSFGAGSSDLWVVKLDLSGNVLWEYTYGGLGTLETALSVHATADGGYLVGGDTPRLLKLDADGVLLWEKAYGGKLLRSLQPTSDGGAVLGIHTYELPMGGVQWRGTTWVVKVDAGGTIEWQRYIPDGYSETCTVREVPGDGYLLAVGYSSRHLALYKLTDTGDTEWETAFSIDGYSFFDTIQLLPLADGSGYALALPTAYASGNTGGWLGVVDLSGDLVWHHHLKHQAEPASFRQTPEGGFLIAGETGAVGAGGKDALVMKIDADGYIDDCTVLVNAPSPATLMPTMTFSDSQEAADPGSSMALASSAYVAPSEARTYLACYAPPADDDTDGVPDNEEMGPWGFDDTYDGNGDGLADHDQDDVASFHIGTGEYVTLATSSGVLVGVEPEDNPSPGDQPDSVAFQYDFFKFVVDDLTPGGAVQVTLYLPEGAAPESYVKYGPTPDDTEHRWYHFDFDGTTGAVFNGNVVTLYFVDGLRGDDDLVADGRVVEPGTPAVAATPLPVTLTGLDALVDGQTVTLHWATATETNNAGFTVQHQPVGATAWVAVGFVDGHGTTSQPQAYTFRLADLTLGQHRFRLQQADYDGSVRYSTVVEATIGLADAYLLTATYPNPFNAKARFALAVQQPQTVRVMLYNVLGQRVMVLHEGPLTAQQRHWFTIDGTALASGTYFLQVNGEHFTSRREVVLLK